jgi:hypothetical protein
MKTRKVNLVNQTFLEQTRFDSGSPGGLSAVVHHFSEAGECTVSFLEHEEVIEQVGLAVAAGGEARAAPAAGAAALTLDLAAIRQGTERGPAVPAEGGARFDLERGGYVTFSLPPDQTNAAIRVQRRDTGPEGEAAFDSRRLGEADVFAVTLVRPGRYTMRNALTGAQGTITVAYPVRGREAYRPPAPQTVQCTAEGFAPGDIGLQPAQGLIFRFAVPSRIEIELAEADDGPAREARPRKVRWQKRGNPRQR